MDIIHSGESMAKCVSDSAKERMPAQGVCRRCGYISSMDVCKVKAKATRILNSSRKRILRVHPVCQYGL